MAFVFSLAQRVKDNTTVVAAALESGDSTDIEQAIAQTRSTLDLADIDPVARNECLTLLSSLDYLQFELTGEGVYLDRASSQMKEVLDTDAAPELVVTEYVSRLAS